MTSLVLAVALIGANPEWPPTDPGLPPAALADPARWPDDPGYGPGESCRGQWGLYSFAPPCAPSAAGPAGARVDRAWLWTVGRPDVTVAVLGDGHDPSDRDLVTAWRLDPGEVPPPGGADRHDVNGDGVFDVRDFTTATGTETPTLDRVVAADLVARDDRGDTNGNGLLDPQDILRLYADGQDNDGDGYVDDVCGWDFVDDDNDPFHPMDSTGPSPAHWAVARANDGFGLAGACPRCSGLPLRVSVRGASEPARLALAVLFAVDQAAPIAMVAAAAWGDRPELHAALDYAEARGTAVLLGRGRTPGRTFPVTWPADQVVQVGSVGPEVTDFSAATRFDAPDPCGGDGVALNAPGRCDDAGLGITAGVAGLVIAAARGLPANGVAPWPAEPTPGQLRALLTGTAREGAVLDARAAVDATIERVVPTPARIEAPADNAVFDPSQAEPIPFQARLPNERTRPVTWTVEAGPGFDDPTFTLIEAGRTEPGAPPIIRVDVPSVGWTRDPAAAARRPGAFALTLRLTTRTAFDGRSATVELRRTVHVHRDLTILPAFPVLLPAGVTGATRVVDLNDDGRGEVVIATQAGELLTVTATGAVRRLARAPVWPPLAPGPSGHANAPAFRLGISEDWRDALPAGATAERFDAPGSLWALTAGGVWLRRGRDGDVATSTVASEDGDGWSPVAIDDRGEVYFVKDDRLFKLDASGRRHAGFPVSLGSALGPPAVGDLDGDGRTDIVVANDERVWRIRPDGGADPGGPIADGWPVDVPPSAGFEPWGLQVGQGPHVVLADIDADDESVEIVVAVAGRPAFALDRLGRSLSVASDAALTGAMAIGPLDEPDAPWALLNVGRLASARRLESNIRRAGAFDWLAGRPPEPYPVPWGDVMPLDPVLIDIEGDDRAEALWPEGPDRLRALDRDGNPPSGWPKLTGDEVVGPPAVGDLDADGRREIVVATRRGWVFAWRTTAETADAAPWDGHRHDVRASGDLRSPTRPVPIGSDGCGCTAEAEGTRAPWAVLIGLLAGAYVRSCLARRTR